MLEQQLVIED